MTARATKRTSCHLLDNIASRSASARIAVRACHLALVRNGNADEGVALGVLARPGLEEARHPLGPLRVGELRSSALHARPAAAVAGYHQTVESMPSSSSTDFV